MTRRHALALACLIQLSNPAAADSREIRMIADYEKQQGALVEIATQAFVRAGYRVSVHYAPWARALLEAQNGRYDVLLGAYYTNERAKTLAFSDPIGHVDISLLALKKLNIRYKTLQDLKPYRIGTIINASVSPEFDHADYLHKEPVTDIEQNLKKMAVGRLDLIAYKKDQLAAALMNTYPALGQETEFLTPPLSSNQMYCAFPLRTPLYKETLANFNRGLQSIKKDGTFDRIVKKHPVPFQ